MQPRSESGPQTTYTLNLCARYYTVPCILSSSFFHLYFACRGHAREVRRQTRNAREGLSNRTMGLTIRDVAKAAGVSTATVSNVLNKTGKVGRRTHLLVLSTVKRLGYFPNVHARHLASRDSRTLGIIVSDIENPFFPEVIKSFEVRARQLGYDAILSDTNYNPRRTREAAQRMMEHNVRGVAVMTSEISMQLITTVDVHREMVGQMAADALHELSRSANPQGKEYQIPAELILGDSSGPAPSE